GDERAGRLGAVGHRSEGLVGGHQTNQPLDDQEPPEPGQHRTRPRPRAVAGDNERTREETERTVGECTRPAAAVELAKRLGPVARPGDMRDPDDEARDCDKPLDGFLHQAVSDRETRGITRQLAPAGMPLLPASRGFCRASLVLITMATD